MLYLLAGFTGGLLIAQLIRFLRGRIVSCAACGQRQWVSPRMTAPCCCRCRAGLDGRARTSPAVRV